MQKRLLQHSYILRYLFLLYYSLQVLVRLWGWGKEQQKITCVICHKTSRFMAFGHPPRYQARCPHCGSLERHRLLAMADSQDSLFAGKSVLHFAPEAVMAALIKNKATRYTSADILPSRADICLNIEAIDQPDTSWDIVLASHVLEHVDDKKALQEIFRILKPGGRLIAMLPIIEAWDKTYENPAVHTPEDRTRHFGQFDHVRYYGQDFKDRVSAAGFMLHEFTATGQECVEHSLVRGEKIFICNKS